MVWSSAREVAAISSRPSLAAPTIRRPSASSPTTSAIARMSPSMARRTRKVASIDRPIDSSTSAAIVSTSVRNSDFAALKAVSLRVRSSVDSCTSWLLSRPNSFSALLIEAVAVDWSIAARSIVPCTLLR